MNDAIFVVGSDSDPEDDFSPSIQSRHRESNSVLSAKDVACIAVHCGLNRKLINSDPPWLATLLQRQASPPPSNSCATNNGPVQQPTGKTALAAHKRGVNTAAEGDDAISGALSDDSATQSHPPRGRRNSITHAIMNILRPTGEKSGDSTKKGGDVAGNGRQPGVAACLKDALMQAGFGCALDAGFADTVFSGGDRVPRLLFTLGQALRNSGGLDEPRIFLQTPAPGELLRELWRLGLADPPAARTSERHAHYGSYSHRRIHA